MIMAICNIKIVFLKKVNLKSIIMATMLLVVLVYMFHPRRIN